MLVRIIAMATLLCASAISQTAPTFEITKFAWNNYSLAGLVDLSPFLPKASPKKDGIWVTVVTKDTISKIDEIELLVQWRENGKLYQRVQHSKLDPPEGTPVLIRKLNVVIDSGPNVDMATVAVEVKPIKWETVEVADAK